MTETLERWLPMRNARAWMSMHRMRIEMLHRAEIRLFIELTQKCLTRFWQLDPELVISYFDKDIL